MIQAFLAFLRQCEFSTKKNQNTPFNQRKVLVTLEADLLSLQNYILEGKECAMLVWGGDVTAESKFS